MKKEIFNIWDEIFYSPYLHQGSIYRKRSLYELRPVKWVIKWVTSRDGYLWWTVVRYTVGKKWRAYDDKDIHTVFHTEDEYFEYLASEILKYNVPMAVKIFEAIKMFFYRGG